MGAVLVCGNAQALEKVDYVSLQNGGININDGKVYIKPINGNYGQSTTSTVKYHVQMKAACKGSNSLKTAYVAFGEETVGKNVIEASGNYKQNVGTNLAKSMGWKDVALDVPLTKIGFNPAAMCQNYLNTKVQQGASKMQVLASQHIINQPVYLSAVAGCGKVGRNNDQYKATKIGTQMKIICKAGSVGGINDIQLQTPKPSPGPGGFQASMQITDLKLKATPRHVSGTCPIKAKFTGGITVSAPGTVQYRVIFPGSAKTSIRSLKFNKAGTRSIGTAEYMADKSMPVAVAGLEIISPVSKKEYADFDVTCLNVNPQKGIQALPGQNAAPAINKIQTMPKLQAIPKLQAAPKPRPGTRPTTTDPKTEVRRKEDGGSRALLLPAIQK
jgi:hypothetical protein